MIAQRFESTKDFAKEWNNRVYSRLSKILCGFKDKVRARPSGENCGLTALGIATVQTGHAAIHADHGFGVALHT